MSINTGPHIHSLVMCANIFVRKDGKYLMLKRSPQKKFAPNVVHPIGGKLDPNENPYLGAQREVFEEAGIKVNNMRLEAVILEITPHPEEMDENWLIFHFSADYGGGALKATEEGELMWLTKEQILASDLFPSVRQLIGRMLNPDDGTVFVTFEYDTRKQIAVSSKRIDLCVR